MPAIPGMALILDFRLREGEKAGCSMFVMGYCSVLSSMNLMYFMSSRTDFLISLASWMRFQNYSTSLNCKLNLLTFFCFGLFYLLMMALLCWGSNPTTITLAHRYSVL